VFIPAAFSAGVLMTIERG